MRGRKAFINTVFSTLEEIVSFICGFILPRLILTAYGSKYNGLIASITQFLSFAVLLRSGIGGVTRAALYKPLAEKDQDKINRIVRASDLFMKRVGLILAGLIVAFAVLCPVFTKDEFSWFFTFSLFIVIGISKFAESFFGITYYTVLQADQRLWVASLMKTVCYILNTLLGALLIYMGASIHMVKLGSTLIYVAYPVALNLYVGRHYRIDRRVPPDTRAISQRWDAFWQEAAVFVMNNTDIMVLTVFTNMLEVSVYSVYNMVVHGLQRMIYSLTNGLEAAFGNMIAKKEMDALNENLSVVENLMYTVSTFLYTSAALLILGFVRIYTSRVNDVDYIRPLFAYIIILAQFCSNVRRPYQLVVQAAGHYRQTRNGAIIEPVLNLTLSVILVIRFGMVGVAVGTLAAAVFRTVQYSHYMRTHIITGRKWYVTPLRFLVSFCESALSVWVVQSIGLAQANDYFTWFFQAVLVCLICGCITAGGNALIFPRSRSDTIKKLKAVFHK